MTHRKEHCIEQAKHNHNGDYGHMKQLVREFGAHRRVDKSKLLRAKQ